MNPDGSFFVWIITLHGGASFPMLTPFCATAELAMAAAVERFGNRVMGVSRSAESAKAGLVIGED